MTIPLNLEGAFSSKESLHEMIVHRKVCFDHAPFEDPHHLPLGDDPEHHELVGNLKGVMIETDLSMHNHLKQGLLA